MLVGYKVAEIGFQPEYLVPNEDNINGIAPAWHDSWNTVPSKTVVHSLLSMLQLKIESTKGITEPHSKRRDKPRALDFS